MKKGLDTVRCDLWANSKNAYGTDMKDKAGKILPLPFIEYPSQPSCSTCHDPHRNGSFMDSVQAIDPTFDVSQRP
jgi:hypothetical protein